jgi:N-acetyltransferase
MFAFLKRKPGTSNTTKRAPLQEESGNSIRQQPGREPVKKKVRLTQTQLDLGGDIRKTCPECGMSFIPSSIEDVALHKKHHVRHAARARLQLSKATVDLLRTKYNVVEGEGGGFVAVVGRNAPASLRRTIESLVDVVNMEMAAVDIDSDTLWSTIQARRIESSDAKNQSKATTSCDRYKVLVYVKEQKCVGLCLAERISQAFVCVGSQEDSDAAAGGSRAAIKLGNGADEALLGISRIWTSSEERRTGLASALLNAATDHFLYGMKIAKVRVAFSQPTESGGLLARRWFGQPVGWHVYTTSR